MDPSATSAAPSSKSPPPRQSLNGCWKLDKTKTPWSIQEYLAVMNVDALAIAAHEKGEQEHDTFHTIQLTRRNVKITKRSRVNNDLLVDLTLGQESVESLSENRTKRMIAVSDHPGHLTIRSKMQTMNGGNASVTDIKRLVEGNLVQELTVVNDDTGASHTTIRHFQPYHETPPHLVVAADDAVSGEASK